MSCTHSEAVTIDAGETLVNWCPFCGAILDNNGDHGAAPGEWRLPSCDAVAVEREACAKLADYWCPNYSEGVSRDADVAHDIAASIRSRARRGSGRTVS
jgi:hypothetical protein